MNPALLRLLMMRLRGGFRMRLIQLTSLRGLLFFLAFGGIIWLLTHPNLSGAFNFTAPKAVTNKEFTRHLAQTLHRPIFFPMLAPVLKLLFGEMSTLLLTGQNIVPSRLTASGFEFRYTELPAALHALVGNK